MDSIYIPDLINAPGHKQEYDVQERLDNLETLTPVGGRLEVVHHGNFLDVKAIAETIVTLACDRCLQQYNHRLKIDVSELIWLQDPIVVESSEDELGVEVAMDDLVETLSPKGHFYPSEWLYEQLCLALPQRQLCDADCAGIVITSPSEKTSLASIDQRWASLQALKGTLPH